MIIENAFLKLPELLTSNYDHRDTFEASVGHFFAVAVLMELQARNIPRAYQHVLKEKPYPTRTNTGRPIHSDVFVNLNGAIETQGRMASYGVREQNWLELKAFLSSTRSTRTVPKTSNAGKVLRDLLRLCILPEEFQGSIRQNGRYFLLVCSDPVKDHLALQKREWLSTLFSEGNAELHIDLSKEPNTLQTAVGSGFVNSPELQADFKVRTMVFQPERAIPSPVFWGYLIRILHFDIAVPGCRVVFDDQPGDIWEPDRIQSLQNLRHNLLEKLF